MKAYNLILVILCFFFSNTIIACDCIINGFCEAITEDSKVIEARFINFYEATNSYYKYADIEITSHLYGLDTLSYDTLTIIDYYTTCDVGLHSLAEIGDNFLFIFEELETEEEANYPIFNLDLCNLKFLQLRGDSIAGIFIYEQSLIDFYLHPDTIAYEPFKNDIHNACELLKLTTSLAESIYDISIFPNPVHENLNVKMNPVHDAKYQIYSNTGEIIELGKISQQGNFNVNISHFSSGIYYLQIHTEEQMFNKKIVKL